MKKFNFKLQDIDVSKIEPNPDNPRGEKVRDNDDQFEYLRRSIDEFGLIVPLIVQEVKGGEKFRLLDGERRYWALKELGIKSAPANVITDKISENEAKNVMFHIHTNRVQWDACQQCKALEPVYELLKREHMNDEVRIAKELVKLTSTHPRTINDRLNFLRWPEKIKEYVYAKKPELYWTIAEIESGIIIPAEKNFPEYFKKVSKDEIRELLLKKYIDGKVFAATEVRKARCIVRTTEENTKQHKFALDILKRLVEKVDYTFEEAQEDFLSKYPEAEESIKISYRKMFNQVSKLTTILTELDIILLKSLTSAQAEDLKQALSELEIAISNFKKEAQEYIK